MNLRRASLLLLLLALDCAQARDLRVCADPNNLPFSNAREQGFENAIATLLARDLQATLRYTWWAQRRGAQRHTLGAGTCDVVIGVPTQVQTLATTRPYYRSSWVFVTRRVDRLALQSLDDPRLRTLRIGVPLAGGGAVAAPALALTRRAIAANVRGYPVYGDYAQADPPAAIVHALARGEIDVALVWGPLAGYFAPREPVALTLTPLHAEPGDAPMDCAIALGVRRSDAPLRRELDAALERERSAIDAILRRYGVPLLVTGAVSERAGAAP